MGIGRYELFRNWRWTEFRRSGSSIGRAEYPCVTDAEVVAAFQMMARSEGIIPALESAHALAWIIREAPMMQGQIVLMNLSGRGDKDVEQMMEILG